VGRRTHGEPDRQKTPHFPGCPAYGGWVDPVDRGPSSFKVALPRTHSTPIVRDLSRSLLSSRALSPHSGRQAVGGHTTLTRGSVSQSSWYPVPTHSCLLLSQLFHPLLPPYHKTHSVMHIQWGPVPVTFSDSQGVRWEEKDEGHASLVCQARLREPEPLVPWVTLGILSPVL
jgi:hypothetical protein